jgi:predicted transcriptional regulator
LTVERTLLISLRPRFANAILLGAKTVEVRRRAVNAPPGTPIILYASSPVRAVVGTARLLRVDKYGHDAAWRRFGNGLGLTRFEFDAYLEGTSTVFLLHLQKVRTLNQPLPLRRLQEDGPFRPPQSFRYVAESDPSRLRALANSNRSHAY